MQDITPNLSLPLIAAGQAQKHVTHNEGLALLDSVVQLAVLDSDRTSPPAAPTAGQRHLVASVPTGAWVGKAGAVAWWDEGAWRFLTPAAGWRVWVASTQTILVHDGVGWEDLKVRKADRFGVVAAADDINRLAVASAATLFTHAGGGHQMKINKAASADTASLLFQMAWSGRAEVGLAGDDNLAVKVSADGTTWRDAIKVDSGTGAVETPSGMRIPDGAKIENPGGAATSGLVLEGGGSLGKTALVVKSVPGLTGALFEQRATNPGIDLIDFGFKTLSHQINLRVESRTAFTLGGFAPELQIGQFPSGQPVVNLFAVSNRQAVFRVPAALASYTLAALPAASSVQAGALVFVSNATGGGVPAYSNGSTWRRLSDNTQVS
jgi:hypothetical protein